MDANGKIIVTNMGVLTAKYGEEGVDAIRAALDGLISADEARGITTSVVALDDSDAMAEVGGSAVTDPADPSQNKAAIDAVWASSEPAYLMILGAIDVVPHQDLANPIPDDEDTAAFGDLPYASNAPYSQDASDFLGPTRVVGRLPDQTGVSDPAYLVGLIERAASAQPRPRSDYSAHLGVSARVWSNSTGLSLSNLFGSTYDLKLSPTDGPQWAANVVGRRTHFINCHGAAGAPEFYGQEGSNYPVAHTTAWLSDKIEEGTVAAAECCYGAELFDPNVASGESSICNAYLAGGAYGFFGSSTIAYGPAQGNGAADLICQYFLRSVLAGASLGRAALEARQEFVRVTPVMDPADLKTLAQFSLLGDPSIQAVEAPAPEAATATALTAKHAVSAPGRKDRRRNLVANGIAVAQAASYAQPTEAAPSDSVQEQLSDLQSELGMKGAKVLSFEVTQPPMATSSASQEMAAKGGLALDTLMDLGSLHLLVAQLEQPLEGRRPLRLVVAREEQGQIESVRELFGH